MKTDKILTMDKHKINKIKSDIAILDAGYICGGAVLSSAQAYKESYLLIVSRSDNTSFKIGNEFFELTSDQFIIYLVNGLDVTFVDGKAVYVQLSGILVNRYIEPYMLDTKVEYRLDDKINNSIGELETIIELGFITDSILASKIGFTILIDLWTHQSSVKQLPKLIKDAVNVMEEEFCHLYGVDDLADMLGINKSYLIRLFTKNLKLTPGQYLEKLRIKKAKNFLASGEFSIEMVAKLCGYSCANYFGKVFKKNTGVSPSNYVLSVEQPDVIDIPPEFYV